MANTLLPVIVASAARAGREDRRLEAEERRIDVTEQLGQARLALGERQLDFQVDEFIALQEERTEARETKRKKVIQDRLTKARQTMREQIVKPLLERVGVVGAPQALSELTETKSFSVLQTATKNINTDERALGLPETDYLERVFGLSGLVSSPAEQGAAEAEQDIGKKKAISDILVETGRFTQEEADIAAGLMAEPKAVNPVNIRMPDGSISAFDPKDPALKNALAGGGVEIGLNVQAGSAEELLGKKALGQVETGLVDIDATLSRLDAIQELFRPEFLERLTKLKVGTLAEAEKLGIELSAENKQLLTDATKFRRRSINNMNLEIKRMTGAQMSEPEAQRLRKGMADPEKDSPTEFEAKMVDTLDEMRAAAFRGLLLRRMGLQGPITEQISSQFGLERFRPPADEPGAVITSLDDQGNPIFRRPDGSTFSMIQ